jgi:hypothetical protein
VRETIFEAVAKQPEIFSEAKRGLKEDSYLVLAAGIGTHNERARQKPGSFVVVAFAVVSRWGGSHDRRGEGRGLGGSLLIRRRVSVAART